MTSKMPNYVRKLLLKLLGISDYIENLEKYHNEDNNTITELYAKNTELRNQLKDAEQELEETCSSLNQLLNTKSTLIAEVLKLREKLKECTFKLETLELSNSEYLASNEDLVKETKQYKDTEEQWLKHDKEFRLNLSEQLHKIAEEVTKYL